MTGFKFHLCLIKPYGLQIMIITRECGQVHGWSWVGHTRLIAEYVNFICHMQIDVTFNEIKTM